MNRTEHGEILIMENSSSVAEEGARRFAQLAQVAITTHGRFSVALSGGNTPRLLHETLARLPYRDTINWNNVHIFWGDERFVPSDDPDSNFLMAQETLLSRIPIPRSNVYPLKTVGVTAEDAADRYSQTLDAFFNSRTPRFDLILLGLGPDGHTASLFPGDPEVTSPSNKLVAVTRVAPKPPAVRLTLTLKVINQAANIIFLVTGIDKSAIVQKVLQKASETVRLPAQCVQPTNGTLLWLFDKEAAHFLNR
jgi:6-phosphogluconolactonase